MRFLLTRETLKKLERLVSESNAKMMELMRSQQPSPGADMGADPNAPQPPSASPMSTPEPRMGTQEAARINVGLAMDLLEQSLPGLSAESDEGQKVMSALKSLTAMMGPRTAKTNGLKNAEILQMLQTLPSAGGGSPEARAMSASPPMPGAPPGAPPPMPPGMPGGMPPMPPGGGAPPM